MNEWNEKIADLMNHGLNDQEIADQFKAHEALAFIQQYCHHFRVGPPVFLSPDESASGETDSAEPSILIICQGGLVQEVRGIPAHAYEICDIDAFEDDPPREAIRYFHDLSGPMKLYLRTSSWKSSLPFSIQSTTEDIGNDVANWENEGGQPLD